MAISPFVDEILEESLEHSSFDFDFENELVVSLERSVEPLLNILPQIQHYVSIAKEKCTSPADNLTQDQSGSIMLFTMRWEPSNECLHFVLNKILRGNVAERNEQLMPWRLYLKLFLQALDRLLNAQKCVYRNALLDLNESYPKGRNITWSSFLTCNEPFSAPQMYLTDNQDTNRTIIRIECRSAKDIRNHSCNPDTDNILIYPGTQFKVVNSRKAKTSRLSLIHLHETDSLPKPQKQRYFNVNPLISILLVLFSIAIAVYYKYPISSTHPLSNENTIQQKTRILVRQPTIPIDSKWSSTGITVAGSNGKGARLDQLNLVSNIDIDENFTIYVADTLNNRIVSWKQNATNGDIVVGRNERGKHYDQLNRPMSVIFDQEAHNLIICDSGNRRIVQSSLFDTQQNKGTILVKNISCAGLAMDNEKSLYISDQENNQIIRYRLGESSGIIVAGGNGKGSHLNQFESPQYISVDQENSVYISDCSNNRVTKWKANAKEGILVAGGHGPGASLNQLNCPLGLIIDTFGTIYVSDSKNDRIMRWLKESNRGNIIAGNMKRGIKANQLNRPIALSFDPKGNLYVADFNNNRIQKFPIEQ